jgi:hypothetical protein
MLPPACGDGGRGLAPRYGTRSPLIQEITRIIDFYIMVPDGALHELLDIGGSMGTVPRQESVPNSVNAPSGTFKVALLICLIFSAPPARGRKIKI